MPKITKIKKSQLKVSHIFQIFLNTTLILLAIALSILLAKELIYLVIYALFPEGYGNQYLHFERILIFFLYFEFIAMIIKYFQENYHFPLRYFLYIGITALVRLVIVDHDNAFNTFLHTCAILVLIISYYIIYLVTSRKQRDESMQQID